MVSEGEEGSLWDFNTARWKKYPHYY